MQRRPRCVKRRDVARVPSFAVRRTLRISCEAPRPSSLQPCLVRFIHLLGGTLPMALPGLRQLRQRPPERFGRSGRPPV